MAKTEEKWGSRLKTLARGLCGVAGAIALLAIVGWMQGSARLKSGIPDRPPMLLSTAVCWMLASVCVLISLSREPSVARKIIQRILASLLFLIGFCGAADSPTLRAAIENSIASLLPFGNAAADYDPSLRGGLSPVLIAIALLCFYSRPRYAQRIYQGAAILPIFVALLALIGHAYNVGSFYGASGLELKTTISLPGAIASVLIGAALLAARPELETTQLLVSNTVGGYVARRLLLAPVFIPLVTGFVLVAASKSSHYDPQIANWLLSFTNIVVFSVLIGLISFLLQRTDLKRQEAEETIRQLNESLEGQVRKRTDELTQTNLRLEREMDERKKTEDQLLRAQRVECLGTLAGGIAHDLNNMLSPIAMASALIEADLKTEDSKRYMEIISKSAQRGTDLIKQIMMFARGTKGEMQKLDVTIVLRDLQKTMEATLPRSIRMQVRFAQNLPLLLADPTQICQVLMNLCVNARDAMPDGGTLKIEAEAVAANNSHEAMVQIKVSDTGGGIPQEHLSLIFEPFFTTKEPGKGTGLGLATVRRIVETHGGAIYVESELGKGSAFTVAFPAGSRNAQSRTAAAEEFKGSSEHILVVEDELALREIVKATLEQAHYVVTTASNGIEALEAIQHVTTPIELVLTDFEMPFMTGDELVQQLAERSPLVPFVVMTGSLEMAGKNARESDQYLLLPKPFTKTDLLRVVHSAIYLRASTAPTAAAGL